MANTNSTKSKTKLGHDEYTVAWISALPREQSTVFLDKTHETLPMRRKSPVFILGEIAGHNVVLAVLPSMGIAETAKCMAQLEANFESLRFVLLVGIAGGAPSKKSDIRLGDLVVSRPGKNDTAVLQYDFGTNIQGPESLRLFSTKTGVPDPTLVTAVSSVEMEDKQSQEPNHLARRLLDYTETVASTYPQLANCRRPADDDLLFLSEYEHSNPDFEDEGAEEDCTTIACDTTQVQQRAAREPAGLPRVWHGLIGSGDEVMRNAHERDRLARERGVLCFEMEAAGLSTQTGWLVIRGICDYCDSHKNKRWQDHAALMAAAYAREVLAKVAPLDEVQAAGARARGGQGDMRSVKNTFGHINVTGGNVSFGNQQNGMATYNFGR